MTREELINVVKQYPIGENGLKYRIDYTDGDVDFLKVTGFTIDEIFFDGYDCGYGEEDFKPILEPLSSLTEEIERNGDKFCPLEKLYGKQDFKVKKLKNSIVIRFSDEGFQIRTVISNHEDFSYDMKLGVFRLLIDWKFDVFGLIEKDYAISTKDEKLKGIKVY